MKKTLIFTFVIVAGLIRRLLEMSRLSFSLLFLPGTSGFRTKMGLWKAWYAFEKAKRECPAYASFLRQQGARGVVLNGWTPDFSGVPMMDKPNFIKVYSMADRCRGGKLPVRGSVIDQSSGSTGKPTNWVRGPEERRAVARTMQLALRQLVGGDKQILFINAFALGPWATGMCVSNSIVDECLLISCGPDIDKIVGTMQDFGPDQFMYVVAGYPPFLKMLVDNKAIDWKKFQAIGFYGGEGMSEGLRDYLLTAFKEVYGDYGASDLEINIGAENAFTVELRRLMAKNEKVRRRFNHAVSHLAGCERLEDGLPHIFQYNQLDYVVESNEQGELLITLCRASNISPRIKYNIHDNGHVMSYDDAIKMLREEGINPATLPPAIANLPLMFHYGRSDLAVSWFGCKIPPTDIEKVVFQIPDLAKIYNSFRLITQEDEQHNKQLTIAFELGQGAAVPTDDTLAKAVIATLQHNNQDFRESSGIAAQKGVIPKVVFWGFRQGPFVNSDIRLKNKYSDEK